MRTLATASLALVVASLTTAAPETTATLQGRASQRATPPVHRDAVVPFLVGETLTYDVAYARMLVAGTATARVVERKAANNSTAYALVAEGRPRPIIARLYPVYYKMDALADTSTLLSQWASLYAEESGTHRQSTMFFDRQNKRAFYEAPGEPTAVKDDFAVPADVQDGLTLLYVLRTRQFTAGQRVTVPVADDGSLYTAEFLVQGRERTSVPFGELDAWNIRIRIVDKQQQEVGKNVGVWISTDNRRLPLRIEADLPVGTFSLALREVQ
jgi:hypothetical protein